MAVTTRKNASVDLNEKRIISDEELKDNLVNLYLMTNGLKIRKLILNQLILIRIKHCQRIVFY